MEQKAGQKDRRESDSHLADNPAFRPRECSIGPDDEMVIDGKVLAIVKGERP
jgi:hypothetical protein